MNKIALVVIFVINLWGVDVPIDRVEKRIFKESIKTNSQVVQLPSSTSSITARVGGKVIEYSVKEGDRVKKGQPIATIKSMKLASQLAELKGLKRELEVANREYNMAQKLYDIGVESLQNLNQKKREKLAIVSQIDTIKSQLSFVKNRVGSQYRVYAQTTGVVDKILTPLYSIVDANQPLVSITKGKESFLIKTFIPLKYASKIRVGQKGSIYYGDREYSMGIAQILPHIDNQTQNIAVLSNLDEPIDNLFVNTFLESKIFLDDKKSYLSVKKSAISFFNNEWVVFVPEHHEEEEHEEENHHDEEEEHKEDKDEHNHGHEGEEIPYDIKVVKILKENADFVAIEGLEEHEEYVSGKSYYIKSMLLKSSLGGHGH